MSDMHCNACGFDFDESAAGIKNVCGPDHIKTCPYCGSGDIIEAYKLAEKRHRERIEKF